MAAPTPTYLLSLPLHAVTEVYGTDGLRQRFVLEIAGFDQASQDRLNRALALADRLHESDVRVREPYLNHVLRVAIRIMSHYRVSDVDIVVAALLHDTVEDHPHELAGDSAGDATEAALAALADEFGSRVAGLVGAVTNPRYDPDRDRDEQYRQHVVASLDRDPCARMIKVSDFTDNAVGVVHTVGPKVRRAAVKYRALVPDMRELIARPDTPLDDEVKQHIFGQLELAEQRLAAIMRD